MPRPDEVNTRVVAVQPPPGDDAVDTHDATYQAVAPGPTAVYDAVGVDRYQVGDVLGRGGMGEVVVAYDERVGRTVALKRMRETNEGTTARFLREARIQARLEHPAIVPVHDVGIDPEGRPYFTMKRLVGTTLYDLLRDRTVTQQRLLRVFVDVCNALELAHARGVVHRDIKPANIMAGDFGEVYLLDWGIACVVDGSDVAASGEDAPRAVGTPRYMAPEQARGDVVEPAADVYALGAVLFEILARKPLRPSTAIDTDDYEQPPLAPSACAPVGTVPPELDAVCVSALAVDPAARPTAADLGRTIQRYLDGDRDVERRRALAHASLAAARVAAASGDPGRRADAIAAAGRALALDPESRDAAALVSSLLLTPPTSPTEQPAGLHAVLAATDRDLVVQQRRVAVPATLAYFLFLPLVAWMGVKDAWIIAGLYALVVFVLVAAIVGVRKRTESMMLAMFSHALLLAVLGRIMSPFVMIPALAGMVGTALSASPPLTQRKWLVIGTMVGAMVVPLVLEQLGVLASTWAIVDGKLVISSSALDLSGASAATFLIASNVAIIVVTGLVACSLAVSRREAIQRAEWQAWHLGQLLPATARSS